MTEEIEKDEVGEFQGGLSKTYGIKVGCGTLYVTICYDDQHRFRRLFIPRTSKFHCDLVIRDGLARLATYQGKRNLAQLIRDLKGDKWGHRCDKATVLSEASSCFDAVSKALERWRENAKEVPNVREESKTIQSPY